MSGCRSRAATSTSIIYFCNLLTYSYKRHLPFGSSGDNASVSSGFEGDSGSVGRTPCRPTSQLRRQLSAAFSASAREVNHIDCLRTGFWPRARVYIKRRRHFPVVVSADTLGTEVRSHRCLLGALGGMLCVRQHQCDVATAKQTQI